jgi:hypothetical protein
MLRILRYVNLPFPPFKNQTHSFAKVGLLLLLLRPLSIESLTSSDSTMLMLYAAT